jgi:tetratricopeptide (TPR) repeat protein
VYEKLAEAQAAAEAKDLATAAKILDGMLAGRRDNELNSYELANVYNLYAFIHYSREDYDGALQAYENVVRQPDIPLAMEINTRFTIAQLYFVQERWQDGIAALNKWFEMTDTPNANAYVLLAQGYYQLKDYDKALENIEISPSTITMRRARFPRSSGTTWRASSMPRRTTFRRPSPCSRTSSPTIRRNSTGCS